MSVAERTRKAVREDPALYDALRAGVMNYSAAARELPVDGDEESIATALRRFGAELEERVPPEGRVTVRLNRGESLATGGDGAELRLVEDSDRTVVRATGDLDVDALERVLGRLRTAEIDVAGSALANETLVVAVEKRAGADALRVVEDALGAA